MILILGKVGASRLSPRRSARWYYVDAFQVRAPSQRQLLEVLQQCGQSLSPLPFSRMGQKIRIGFFWG